jgi:hypothetical protein
VSHPALAPHLRAALTSVGVRAEEGVTS